MKKIFNLLLCVLLLLGGSACTHRLTDFTVISTKNVPLGSSAVTLEKANSRVKGVDKIHMITIIPIGSPNLKQAIDNAIEKHPGAVGLADGVVKSSFWWALLYGQQSYIVEGTPLYEKPITAQSSQGLNQNNTFPAGMTNATPATQGVQLPTGNDGSSNFSSAFFHEVKAGDTLSSVANAYGVTVRDLIMWNNLKSQDLTAGDKLCILLK